MISQKERDAISAIMESNAQYSAEDSLNAAIQSKAAKKLRDYHFHMANHHKIVGDDYRTMAGIVPETPNNDSVAMRQTYHQLADLHEDLAKKHWSNMIGKVTGQ